MATDRSDEFLTRLADSNPELIERVIGRQVENIEESGLDPRTHALVRIASLVSVGAPSASFAWQVSLAREAGVSDDEIAGVLVAVGPTAGMPRVVAAAPHVAAAMSS
ncbi:MAG TPA: carboxymuconolactone decarboxylase family protein [Solirubrobacteraceae bacterium]|nr:carboxymuconolactone decarboxylase family protein [Solirubrobacteraceae bacterium]